MGSRLSARGPSMSCPRAFCELPVGCLCGIHCLPTGCPWALNGLLLGRQCAAHALSMGLPRLVHGMSSVSGLWASHWLCVGCPWAARELFVDCLSGLCKMPVNCP